MEKKIIWRGVLSGAVAGVLAFVFAKVFLEPVIGRAIEFEGGRNAAHQAVDAAAGGHSHGDDAELFTRGVQSTIGMGLGVFVFSVAMGALFAVVFCVVHGRAGAVSLRALSAALAPAMLVSLWLVPALKYPPNPPATSLEETITQRALLYLFMVALSALLMVGAVLLGRHLLPSLGAWNATLVAGGAYIVAVLTVMAFLPTIDETPAPLLDAAGTIVFPGFPAADLYEFRLYAMVVQIIIWSTIGLVFAALVSRLAERPRRAAAV